MARIVSGPEITGLVTNKQTGTPIGGATVTVSATVYTDPDFTSGTTTLTADGSGVFFCYATNGTYTFTTTTAGAGPIESVTVRGSGGGGGSSGASVSDATTGAKGIVQLAGDLAGTAASPTVPGLTAAGSWTAVAKTANYTAGDRNLVLADAGGGGFTVTLPTATAGRRVMVKKTDATTNGVILTDGTTTFETLTVSGAVQWFTADGTAWHRMSRPQTSAIAATGTPSSATFLRGDGTWTAPAGAVDVQTFTASGTWTKPAGVTYVRVVVVGGGGGGGSGRRGAAGTARGGGNGAGGAGQTTLTMLASSLAATESVTVGAAGSGGAAVTVDDTNGNTGGTGGVSSFSTGATRVLANGGTGGAGGVNTSGSGGGGGSSGSGSSGGAGGASAIGAGGGAASVSVSSSGGGGAGGGITAGDVAGAGGSGTFYSLPYGVTTTTGAAVGQNGISYGGPFISTEALTGPGGSGGGASITGAAGNGGDGSIYGGGGAGGGASLNGNASGKGGNGTAGRVMVESW